MTLAHLAILARIEAKPEKAVLVEHFLQQALTLAETEDDTTTWFAVKLGETSFAIFDTFKDESGRESHLNGEIAKALFAKADELLSRPPEIIKAKVIPAKLP